MISRQELLATLEELKTDKNYYEIQRYINSISSLDDDALVKKLEELGVTNKKQIKKFVKKDLKQAKNKDKKQKFKELNELVSYGVNGRAIVIHLVPKDIHSMLNSKGLKKGELALVDALEKIQRLIKEDKRFKKIEQVYAVSGIITRPITRIFDNLDFDVKVLPKEETKKDEELSKFYFLVEGKDEFKNLGRAQLSREKLFSPEWNELKAARKQGLEKAFDKEFIQSLQNGVKNDTEIKSDDFKEKTKVIETGEQEKTQI